MTEDKNPALRGIQQSVQTLLRDCLAVTFRHRQLIRKAFIWSLFGGILAVMLVGINYESDAEIAVRPWTRTPAAVTADSSPRPLLPGTSNGTEEMINSEIELLTSADILEHVVVTCQLQYGPKKWYTPYKLAVYRAIPGYWDNLIPKAVAKLNDNIEIDEVKSSDMLTISYSSPSPDVAACVTRALNNFYMAKHVATWRPAKMFDFFAEQTQDYQKRLYDDEQKLIDFDRTQDAVEASAQLGLDVSNQAQFLASLRQTQASVAGVQEQIRADQAQVSSLPARIPTSQTQSDNAQLLADLKSALANLEMQRTSLLVKYDPSYPLVTSVDTQIAQAKQAIAEQETAPVRDSTTDQNPVYTQVAQDLAKQQGLLPNLQAVAATAAESVKQYHDASVEHDQKAMTVADLQREVNAMQGNYLLYLSKREEARIEDMLDARRVDNVTVIKPPTIPVIPTFNPLVLVALAFILAGIIAVSLAFVADYLDPSFRTPDEVQEFLNVPVFASIPENGQEVGVGAVSKNGH